MKIAVTLAPIRVAPLLATRVDVDALPAIEDTTGLLATGVAVDCVADVVTNCMEEPIADCVVETAMVLIAEVALVNGRTEGDAACEPQEDPLLGQRVVAAGYGVVEVDVRVDALVACTVMVSVAMPHEDIHVSLYVVFVRVSMGMVDAMFAQDADMLNVEGGIPHHEGVVVTVVVFVNSAIAADAPTIDQHQLAEWKMEAGLTEEHKKVAEMHTR
jgi:hypothetical protein